MSAQRGRPEVCSRAPDRNDELTIAAIGLIAMCLVTFDHEAGHGSACLLLRGHMSFLTSSLFRCDVPSTRASG
jgi:hypothetical protein